MRQRVEDLGRLSVMIDDILELPVWELFHGRNKDFVEYFESLEQEKQWDLLHDFIYGLDRLKDELHECLSIAKGWDILNEKEE